MKKVIIIVLGLLLVCCCCTVIGGVLLFTSPAGYVEFNGRCLHKGTSSNPTTGPCATMMGDLDNRTGMMPTPATTPTPTQTPAPSATTTIKYTGDHSSEYAFSYPKSFFLDDSSSIVYVYKKDPKLNVAGDFNDNLNITSADTALVVNQKNCTSYANELVASLGSTINVDSSTLETKIDTINGLDVCAVRWSASLNGTSFKQEQYVFSDSFTDKNYILTVSLSDKSTNADLFTDVVYSFETK